MLVKKLQNRPQNGSKMDPKRTETSQPPANRARGGSNVLLVGFAFKLAVVELPSSWMKIETPEMDLKTHTSFTTICRFQHHAAGHRFSM